MDWLSRQQKNRGRVASNPFPSVINAMPNNSAQQLEITASMFAFILFIAFQQNFES